MTSETQLVSAPSSTPSTRYESLGYLEAYDAVMNGDYAFVAYRETEVGGGASRVRIAGYGLSGAVFEPVAMRDRSRECSAKGQPYFTWGASMSSSPSDARCIEFRVYPLAGLPDALEIYVVTRQADGSAQPAKSLRIRPFMSDVAPVAVPLVSAPVSDASRTYESLGYVAAYDAVLNCDYAFVAYKETENDSGAWSVCIKSTQTAGARFDPKAIRLKARETGAQGRPYFIWGYNFEPSAADPRQIEFRVYVVAGAPEKVEMFVRLRRADQSADEPRTVTFPWPQS